MKNKGFSLVELIVVIAIMAILVGVAVPVYTSYIGKANAAKDEQLLGEINSAFMVAAVAEGVTDFTFAGEPENNKPAITVAEDGTIDIENMKPDYLADAMVEILGTDLEFSVIEGIWYNPNLRCFVESKMTFTFDGKEITVNAEDVAILSGDNTFSELGSLTLLEEVGTLERLIGTGAGDDILDQIGESDAFISAFAGYLGLKMEDYADEDAYWTAYEEKLADLDETNPNATTNAMIMYAASSTANASDEAITNLFTYNQNQALTSRIEGATEAETMTNAALSYGMYIAYAQRNNIDTTNVANFSSTVNTEEFAAYCASSDGQTDLEAYRAAMNMIGDNTDNPEITSSILENGINGNDDLAALMREIMGN